MKYTAIALFGLPGAGKGTQGERLARAPHVRHISTGELSHKIPEDSELSRRLWPTGERHKYFSDELAMDLLLGYCEQEQYNPRDDLLVLDGVPRTIGQAKLLEKSIQVAQVIWFDITQAMASANMARRATRPYDRDPIARKKRFDDFANLTVPVRACYPPSMVSDISTWNEDGLRPIRDIEEDIRRALSQNPALTRWFPTRS